MQTRLRSKVTLLFVLSALLLAIPAVAALAQDTGTSTAAPTIQSDKADYAPGELVTLTGSGWQPGESVNIVVNDEEGQTWSRNVDISADASGNITDQFNLPDWFVATYKVTATGELSGVATTSFTDGNIWAKTSGLSIPIFVHWEKYNNNTNCSGIPDFSQGTLMPPNTPQLLTGVDDGQSIRMTLLGGPLGGPEGFVNWTSGSEVRTNLQICVAGSTAEQVWTANYGAAPTSVDTTITASNASATYGDSSATLNASVTVASGPAVNAGTVTFTVKKGATTIGTVTSGTVSNGSASASFPLSGVNADTYTIEAAYNAGTGFKASNNSTQSPAPTLTFNKADTTTTVTCGAGPFTYTGSPHTPCSAKVTGPGGLNEPLTVDYQSNTNVGTATASASFTGSANYNGSQDSKTFTIEKPSQTIDFGTLSDKILGAADFDVSAMASSGLPVSFAASPAGTCTISGNTVHITGVGTCTITASQAGNNNYLAAIPVSHSFKVIYNFSGFRSPVDNPGTGETPVFNSAKAGQSIPVKFGLGGNQDLNIIAAGYPKVTSVNCDTSATVNPIEEYAASTAEGGLNYDATADQYNYIWKTQSTYVNKCLKFDLQLTDGTSHVAYFKFLK